MATFISPYEADRENAIRIIGRERFFLVFVDCALPVCETRDVKGLYKKARRGELKQFTGIDAPYERPLQPDQVINTSALSLEECVARLEISILTGFNS